ncbi:unnamed protein product [Boreogadus saida]
MTYKAEKMAKTCGPLSGIRTSGIPCLAKIDLRWTMTSVDLVCDNCAISTHLEK